MLINRHEHVAYKEISSANTIGDAGTFPLANFSTAVGDRFSGNELEQVFNGRPC